MINITDCSVLASIATQYNLWQLHFITQACLLYWHSSSFILASIFLWLHWVLYEEPKSKDDLLLHPFSLPHFCKSLPNLLLFQNRIQSLVHSTESLLKPKVLSVIKFSHSYHHALVETVYEYSCFCIAQQSLRKSTMVLHRQISHSLTFPFWWLHSRYDIISSFELDRSHLVSVFQAIYI